MNYQAIIDHFYLEDNQLRQILLQHSRMVANRALRICDAHPKWPIDRKFVEEAAMLHDIGICRCHAPGIYCYGDAPYICHGRLGADMLRALGYERHARVCERHTGAGITREAIIRQHLPLPKQDFLPETLEEQIICYADKFYSKTHPEAEKTYEQAEKSLRKFGEDGLKRFHEWHQRFEPMGCNGK